MSEDRIAEEERELLYNVANELLRLVGRLEAPLREMREKWETLRDEYAPAEDELAAAPGLLGKERTE